MAEVITNDNFQETVLDSDKLVVVDFWAEWCGPCRILGPVISELAEDYKDSVVIGKLDVDENPEISGTLGIRSIPTIIFFKNGKELHRQIGVAQKSSLVEKIDSLSQDD